MRATALWRAGLGCTLGMVAFSCSRGHSGAVAPASPAVICGHPLRSATKAPLAVEFRIMTGGIATVADAPGVSGSWLRIASGCDHGHEAEVTPPGVAVVVDKAVGRDGRAIAIALVGLRPGAAVVSVRDDGGVVATATVIVSRGS